MLTVHHLGNSQSERIVWLCEELALPYELIRYEREPTMAAPPEYKALHPLGTAPIISDGELVLAETMAIVEYICRKLADERLLLGPEHPDFAQFLFWYHFANGSMMPAFMMDMAAKTAGSRAAGLAQRPCVRHRRASARRGRLVRRERVHGRRYPDGVSADPPEGVFGPRHLGSPQPACLPQAGRRASGVPHGNGQGRARFAAEARLKPRARAGRAARVRSCPGIRNRDLRSCRRSCRRADGSPSPGFRPEFPPDSRR